MLVFSLTAQVIEKTYTFNEPVIEKVNGYDVVTFDQTGQTGEVGKPSLPWKTVSLLLPQNSAAQDVEIIFPTSQSWKENTSCCRGRKYVLYHRKSLLSLRKMRQHTE